MRPPLQSPFKRALYLIPRHGDVLDSDVNILRAEFMAIPGCPDDLFDRVFKPRNENPVLKRYRDVYFSPVHMHWVVGTYSGPSRIHDPMPSHLGGHPVYCQGTPAIFLDGPKNPQELLDFPVVPGLDLTGDQTAAITKLFPKLAGLYVHRWGHVSLFFHDMRAIKRTFESRFLPVCLGGLSYSFELLGPENHGTSTPMPRPQTGYSPIAFVANSLVWLRHFVSCCGNRKPNLGNRN